MGKYKGHDYDHKINLPKKFFDKYINVAKHLINKYRIDTTIDKYDDKSLQGITDSIEDKGVMRIVTCLLFANDYNLWAEVHSILKDKGFKPEANDVVLDKEKKKVYIMSLPEKEETDINKIMND